MTTNMLNYPDCRVGMGGQSLGQNLGRLVEEVQHPGREDAQQDCQDTHWVKRQHLPKVQIRKFCSIVQNVWVRVMAVTAVRFLVGMLVAGCHLVGATAVLHPEHSLGRFR